MDDKTRTALSLLREDSEEWESQAILWEDERVIGLQNLHGSNRTAKETAETCRARAKKLRDIIGNLSSPGS